MPVIKGRKSSYETSGVGRNNRVFQLRERRARGTVLDELGVFAAIADLYAAVPAARSAGYGRDHFLLDRPGGRGQALLGGIPQGMTLRFRVISRKQPAIML